MERVDLGPLRVSRLCLGTMLMGGRTPAEDAPRLLDAFVEAGHNFLDTADVYGDGTSERTLAPWLARRRDEVVVATKLRFPVSDPGGAGLAPERVAAACDASLRRLGIDVIDLYQVHAPDPDVALEDTLVALDGLVRAGKVRALGASNFPAWLLAWAVGVQDRDGLSPFVSLQPQYSLVERSIETEILPFCRAAGLGVLPWGPLGAGFLTGRYERDAAPPAGTRIGDATDDLEEAHRPPRHRAPTSAPSTRRARWPTSWARASRRSPSPGCSPSRASPRRSSGRARSSSSRTCCPPPSWRSTDEQLARLGRWTAPARGYPERMNIEQNGIDVGTIRLRR